MPFRSQAHAFSLYDCQTDSETSHDYQIVTNQHDRIVIRYILLHRCVITIIDLFQENVHDNLLTRS